MLVRAAALGAAPVSIPPPAPPPGKPALAPTIVAPLSPLCVRVSSAARLLGIGRTKTYELINAGDLDTIKVGQAVLVTMKSLEAFVDRRAAPGKRR